MAARQLLQLVRADGVAPGDRLALASTAGTSIDLVEVTEVAHTDHPESAADPEAGTATQEVVLVAGRSYTMSPADGVLVVRA